MTFEKLQPLIPTPRQATPEVVACFEKIMGRPFFFLPWATKAWDRDVVEAPIGLAAVVQANNVLHDPSTAEFAPAVLLHPLDPSHAWNRDWLLQVASELRAIRANPQSHSNGQYVSARLNDPESSFSEPLPESLAHGVDAWWTVTFLDPEQLPGKCIPADGLLPVWLRGNDAALVPSSLYE